MLRPNRAATLTRQLLNRVGLMVDRSHVVEDQDILEFQICKDIWVADATVIP